VERILVELALHVLGGKDDHHGSDDGEKLRVVVVLVEAIRFARSGDISVKL
jgi:hypothetical protein